MHVKYKTSDGHSQCTCTWETDLWHIVFPHSAHGFAAAAVICRAWYYLCLCLMFSSEPLFSNSYPSLNAKCQVKLSAAAAVFPSHSHLCPVLETVLLMYLWTNFFSNLFSGITQLIMQHLPGYLAVICPLDLFCLHPWINFILFNIKYGNIAFFLQIVLYTTRKALKHIIITIFSLSLTNL